MKFTDDEHKMAKFFIEREGEGILSEIRDLNFHEAGIIDSLDLVTMALYIENNFNVKLDLTDESTFNATSRFDTLMDLILKKQL